VVAYLAVIGTPVTLTGAPVRPSAGRASRLFLVDVGRRRRLVLAQRADALAAEVAEP
jgi:hypothetical protein